MVRRYSVAMVLFLVNHLVRGEGENGFRGGVPWAGGAAPSQPDDRRGDRTLLYPRDRERRRVPSLIIASLDASMFGSGKSCSFLTVNFLGSSQAMIR